MAVKMTEEQEMHLEGGLFDILLTDHQVLCDRLLPK